MDERTDAKSVPPERRRFLRESLTGSVPLLLGWLGGRAADWLKLARHGGLVQAQASPRTSPPPVAKEAAPAETKQNLDRQYQDFARENPDASDPPRS